MFDELVRAGVAVATAIVGVAMLAVLVSRNSNTSQVIAAGSSGFSNALGTAMGPITGYQPTGQVNYGTNFPSFANPAVF